MNLTTGGECVQKVKKKHFIEHEENFEPLIPEHNK